MQGSTPKQLGQTAAGYYSGGSGYSRGETGSGTGSGSSVGDSFGFGSGSSFAVGGAFSGVGAGSYVGSKAGQDAGVSQMIADLLRLSPYGSRPLLQFHWSSPQVPQGMVATRPVFPSSLIVHTDSGYQRARDFRTDSKYTQDTFDHIPQPGTPQTSGSKGHQKVTPKDQPLTILEDDFEQ
ncbi:hypothetical protein CRENBAI_010030 [Crenichthys baileyi]|uniref:Uncharacterized protein n=1 Tax=Crenichthys baileyi TaxID=28760 RepID=A0AAV9S103_9TELE